MEDKIFTKEHVTGTYTETEERIKSDQLLLNTIESERIERMEATNEIFDELGELAMNDVVIWKQLRKYQVTLNFVIGLSLGLLLSMILIASQL